MYSACKDDIELRRKIQKIPPPPELASQPPQDPPPVQGQPDQWRMSDGNMSAGRTSRTKDSLNRINSKAEFSNVEDPYTHIEVGFIQYGVGVIGPVVFTDERIHESVVWVFEATWNVYNLHNIFLKALWLTSDTSFIYLWVFIPQFASVLMKCYNSTTDETRR